MRHRWGDPERPTPQLSMRVCKLCGMRKHTNHEHEGGRPVHWSTFHGADGQRIPGYSRKETPPCVPPRLIENAHGASAIQSAELAATPPIIGGF